MYHLRRDSKYNLAGIVRFFFIDSKDIIKDPRPRLGLIAETLIVTEIATRPGALWYEGLVTKNTLSVRIAKQNRRPGESYSYTLSGSIARNSPELQAVLNSFSGRRFTLIAEDQNGFLRFLGGKEYGSEFLYESESGKRPGEANLVSFKFDGQTPEPPPFMHGNLYDTLSQAAAPLFGDVSIVQRVLEDGFTVRVLAL